MTRDARPGCSAPPTPCAARTPSPPPASHDDVDTITDALRTRLGEEALDAELDAGRRLDRRAAVVLAS